MDIYQYAHLHTGIPLEDLYQMIEPIVDGNNFREGYVTPEATKNKIRNAMLKREQDPEWIARKDEMRAKMSAAKKGKLSTFKGKKMTDASRQKCSEAQLKRSPMSPETREKISLAAKKQWELRRAIAPDPYRGRTEP